MNEHPKGPKGASSSEWAISTYKIAPARVGHRIAVLDLGVVGFNVSQRLYMIGGYTDPALEFPFPLVSMETYGIGIDKKGWQTNISPGFTNRWGHGVAVTGSRGSDGGGLNSYAIWAIGGASTLRFGDGTTPNAALRSVQYIMPTSSPSSWSAGPLLPDPHGRFMVGVAAFENIIYVTGGRDSSGVFHKSTLKWDVSTLPAPGGSTWPTVTWVPAPTMTSVRAAHGVAMTSDGKLWAAGGLSGASLQTPPDVAMRSVEYLDISKNVQFWTYQGYPGTPTSLMSVGRANFQLIAIGMVLYAIGGQSGVWLGEAQGTDTVEFLDTTGIDEGRVLVWKTAPAMNSVRFQLAATAAAGGPAGASASHPTLFPPALYAVGGQSTSSYFSALTSVETYTPTPPPPPGPAWIPIAPMGTPRIRHGIGRMRTLSDQVLQVYAVGGQDGSTLLKSAEVLLAAGWKAIASMSTHRVGLGVAFLGTKLYAAGGWDGSPLASVEVYDTAGPTWTWTDIAPMSISRSGVGVASLGSYLYAVGGLSLTGSQGAIVGSAERYSPSGGWANINPMQTPREGLGVAAVGLFLYAVGGTDSNGTVLASVERYDPTANVWASMTSMGTARYLLGVAALGGLLYAVGGKDSAGNSLTSVEVYDPATNTWDHPPSSANPLPDDMPRMGPGVAVSPTKLYVVGGGKTTATALKTGFSYTPPTI